MEGLRHLLILCCYGGVPYIDYFANTNIKHESTHTLDPTDWIAVDESGKGSLLNASIHPDILAANPNLAHLIPTNISLDQCDLYNLTFSSVADQNIFDTQHGVLSCRCPRLRFGTSCHMPNQPAIGEAQPLVGVEIMSTLPNSSNFSVTMIILVLFIISMVVVFMMVRGCFCDCFGGFKNPFKCDPKYDQPLDQNTVNRCLEAVRAHEAEEKAKYQPEFHRPLIPSNELFSDGCAPYNPPVLPANAFQYPTAPRSCSPPPSYRSQHGSLEYLPGASSHSKI